MKKLVLLSAILLISCFALKAQTTEIKFFNSSLSDEIKINISDLFEGSISVPRNEVVSIVVDNGRLSAKKYSAEIYYSACGNTEKAELIIGKYNKIGDLREPCEESKKKNRCQFPEGRAFVELENGTGKEIAILELNGLSLFSGQKIMSEFPEGRNTLTIESFIDTADHNKGVDKRNYKFFAIQDSSCICKVVIKTIEETAAEDLRVKLKVRVINKTDRKISIESYPFDGLSFLPGGKSSINDAVKILPGFYPLTIVCLDNGGNKFSKVVLKHIVEGDKFVVITQRDIDMQTLPTVKNHYNYPNSRSSRGYYGGHYYR